MIILNMLHINITHARLKPASKQQTSAMYCQRESRLLYHPPQV